MKNRILELNKNVREIINFEKYSFQLYDFNDTDFWYKYHRVSDEKTDFLLYGFFKDKYRENTHLSDINHKIIFPVVNKILLSVSSQFLSDRYCNFNIYDYTVYRVPNFIEKDYHYVIQGKEIVKNRVYDEQAFGEALVLLKEQLETSVLPFFDKIQTLQQVNDEILEKVDWREWSNYISGKAMYKSLIIMKLCNNVRYKEFSQFYKSIVADLAKENADKYHDFHNTLIELLNFLDSGKYLEVK